MRAPDGRRGRALLAAWLAASFVALGGDRLARPRRRPRRRRSCSSRAARRATSPASRASSSRCPPARPRPAGCSSGSPDAPGAGWEPLVALNLRAVLLAFLALAVLARVDVLRALAPWPWATRLLVVVLAQIHALRLLADRVAPRAPQPPAAPAARARGGARRRRHHRDARRPLRRGTPATSPTRSARRGF